MNGMMNPLTPESEMQTATIENSAAIVPQVEAPPKPIREQILEMKDNIQFLERLWLEDESIQQEIDPGEWQRFMKEVYQSVIDIQNIEAETHELKEVEQ
jgi:hypothetical protein